MKILAKILCLVAVLNISCGKPSEKGSEASEAVTEDISQVLYNEAMDIHDEVMPYMGDLNALKRDLNDKITNSPDLVAEKKAELESTVLLIDSASKAMMTWMHEFKPEDYAGEDKRAYLESEIERIKKVKELMNEALEKGKQSADQ